MDKILYLEIKETLYSDITGQLVGPFGIALGVCFEVGLADWIRV